jgi:hypothetical protein
MNMAGDVATQGNFGTFHAVDPGVAARAAAFNTDFQTGDEAQVHEVLSNGMVQLQVTHNGAVADMKIGQRGAFLAAALLPSKYEVENHFQLQLYSSAFLPTGNAQYHRRL